MTLFFCFWGFFVDAMRLAKFFFFEFNTGRESGIIELSLGTHISRRNGEELLDMSFSRSSSTASDATRPQAKSLLYKPRLDFDSTSIPISNKLSGSRYTPTRATSFRAKEKPCDDIPPATLRKSSPAPPPSTLLIPRAKTAVRQPPTNEVAYVVVNRKGGAPPLRAECATPTHQRSQRVAPRQSRASADRQESMIEEIYELNKQALAIYSRKGALRHGGCGEHVCRRCSSMCCSRCGAPTVTPTPTDSDADDVSGTHSIPMREGGSQPSRGDSVRESISRTPPHVSPSRRGAAPVPLLESWEGTMHPAPVGGPCGHKVSQPSSKNVSPHRSASENAALTGAAEIGSNHEAAAVVRPTLPVQSVRMAPPPPEGTVDDGITNSGAKGASAMEGATVEVTSHVSVESGSKSPTHNEVPLEDSEALQTNLMMPNCKHPSAAAPLVTSASRSSSIGYQCDCIVARRHSLLPVEACDAPALSRPYRSSSPTIHLRPLQSSEPFSTTVPQLSPARMASYGSSVTRHADPLASPTPPAEPTIDLREIPKESTALFRTPTSVVAKGDLGHSSGNCDDVPHSDSSDSPPRARSLSPLAIPRPVSESVTSSNAGRADNDEETEDGETSAVSLQSSQREARLVRPTSSRSHDSNGAAHRPRFCWNCGSHYPSAVIAKFCCECGAKAVNN